MKWYLQIVDLEGPLAGSEMAVRAGKWSHEVAGHRIDLEVEERVKGLHVRAVVRSQNASKVFLSLSTRAAEGWRQWSFDGPVAAKEIYRQSPHDVDAWIVRGIARQSVPMVAVHDGQVFHAALNGSPAIYENSCSQRFDPANGEVSLRSGDDGETGSTRMENTYLSDVVESGSSTQKFSPGRIIQYFHAIGPDIHHTFEALIFQVEGTTLRDLRHAVYDRIAGIAPGEHAEGNFGKLAVSTAWMNLRKNDSGNSRYWVVPAVEYSNIQYNRDAFWIAMMLEPQMDRECLLNELAIVDCQAEYPLLTLIWSQRVEQATGRLDKVALQTCLNKILQKAHYNWYHAYTEGDGRHDFQYWQDSMAFTRSDSVAYNQGLLAVALKVAAGHGLDTGSGCFDGAKHNYRSLFNEETGYLSVSRHKTHLFSPDCLLPDLLSQICCGEALLDRSMVESHLATMNRLALTPHGYKVLCRNDGGYPTYDDLSFDGYTSLAQRNGIQPGDYQRGGSWFLYDCISLLDGVLHGVPAAAQLLVWRVRMEMDKFGTTFEYINTQTGQPHKSNMGWNVAIYAILRQLTQAGRIAPEILNQIEVAAK